MLEHLREHIEQAMQGVEGAVLSTYGPAGLQAGFFPCEYANARIYILVPATVDLLDNLAHEAMGSVTSPHWQLTGRIRLVPASHPNLLLHRLTSEAFAWNRMVEVLPERIQLQPIGGPGYAETIDFDLERSST